MALTGNALKIMEFLKDYTKGKDFDRGAIVGIALMSDKKEGFADELIEYCKANPDAESSDVLHVAAVIYNSL